MNNKFTILAYYSFIKIKNIFNCKNILSKNIKDLNIKGIILIAPEGINLNISIESSQYNLFLDRINKLYKFNENELKISYNHTHIFRKIKIKIKKEILTTRLKNEINIKNNIGEYVKPENWNKFIMEKDTILIDTRNFYEVNLGTFNKAINPNAKNFTELLNWLSKNIKTNQYKNKRLLSI